MLNMYSSGTQLFLEGEQHQQVEITAKAYLLCQDLSIMQKPIMHLFKTFAKN